MSWLSVMSEKGGSEGGSASPPQRVVIGSERTRNRRRLSSKMYKSSSPAPASSPSPPPSVIGERSAGDGSSRSDEEAEEAELARLRCPSERTEVVAERELRRRRRCSDYPGISFGASIFSSDTLMKFSVIKNELHNVLNSQLKRVSVYKTLLRTSHLSDGQQLISPSCCAVAPHSASGCDVTGGHVTGILRLRRHRWASPHKTTHRKHVLLI